MKVTKEHNERIAKMTFSSVYPHYLSKVEKKGGTKEELHQVKAQQHSPQSDIETQLGHK